MRRKVAPHTGRGKRDPCELTVLSFGARQAADGPGRDVDPDHAWSLSSRSLVGMALRLYRFRFRDPRTGRWVNARYAASLDDLRARYESFELLGPPEVREVGAGWFDPARRGDDADD